MNYMGLSQCALDYFPCNYGTSKQVFRGPRRKTEGEFVAFIGGTETFGKFIDAPFPALFEVEAGIKAVNLGSVNGGLDAYLNDRSILDICSQAHATVFQLMGAQNLTNRYYSVHPRRNDRFIRASSRLKESFPEIDFTEFHFTGHLLQAMAEASYGNYLVVAEELKQAWVARMQSILSQIDGAVILLWLSDRAPAKTSDTDVSAHEPQLVDRPMLDELARYCDCLVEVEATDVERFEGLEEMYFADTERIAAEGMLGPLVHRRTASLLAPVVKAIAADAG